ncbi:hypothetical protein B0T17DRAFT_481270 [Bombardia bombarda]|uniref:Uncharacterized protein n=1 Tax=Bombardia bombarda TaxID=252184 RepID=A0AA39XIF1_9PEZI|nr:hypothetical protein B0T17DRAFT_481270 [Bombardia bombarda]
MASSSADDDYMNFLNKANQDPSEGYAKPQQQTKQQTKEFKAADADVEIPRPLVEVTRGDGAFYISDADEPFEPVALRWDEDGKELPDEEEFATLIHHWDPKQAEVEISDPIDWNSSGQYTKIIDAVREAGQGNDVRVYRVAKGGVKAEYWVVTTEGKGKGAKLVGVRALAVES